MADYELLRHLFGALRLAKNPFIRRQLRESIHEEYSKEVLAPPSRQYMLCKAWNEHIAGKWHGNYYAARVEPYTNVDEVTYTSVYEAVTRPLSSKVYRDAIEKLRTPST